MESVFHVDPIRKLDQDDDQIGANHDGRMVGVGVTFLGITGVAVGLRGIIGLGVGVTFLGSSGVGAGVGFRGT